MTLYTPLGGLPYPQPTDIANLPLHLQGLAEGIDGRTVLRYATATDRDAAITTPVAGMVAWLSTPGTLSYHTGSAWVAMGAWNTYTPTWTAETTNPAIGNGSLTGKYAIVGKTCHFTMLMQFGSTTTYGSGDYFIGYPVKAGALGGLPQHLGVASSPGGRGVISCQPLASSNATTYTLWGPTSATSSKIDQLGSPGLFGTAWASGNFMRVGGSYEVA
ncbi:hypothetical protein PV367_10715 [Streptomyces europaeiscabiei]|uniref:Uncharacterized protein n=1 Tax=Streptomyces europaeiscabiei TaxID=146819 RepID=A0AAJ2PN52_9ACTN|nr:hypothetical protein [Streptomyces europaeiscabiei]MDX2759325.1 hypothetical protein [Streptomyces europaeiscabiei]MDX2769821.1 hypothetical protein [Streptomyces europaeiscabiei]MDX3130254.1 hypothetical protein [Streptomyces europaeiscabiei]MDX3541648.1 hypothetical protein [Streptomyces europaeiscabiei]MDX3551989.1 hypothetical protein [Streptomyces europaeiscabiei]